MLKNEPDIDIKRRTLIGDTADSLAIRGFSGNRIMLNIDGRPVNASGVVGGYYIDWGTIPLDNIEKIEIIRGGSSVRYGNNALGGVVNVITKKPTETPTATLFGTYGGGEDIDSFQNYRLTHTYKIGALGYSLAGSYQKADPFLWNNDFEGKNLAATIDLDMPPSWSTGMASAIPLICACLPITTGIYTLPLAREAAMVTGLDDSEAMLARMLRAASAAGLHNVGPVTASWKILDPVTHGFEKAFDIAWVSMSPAVQALPDFEKMERCARTWCVYIGWGRKRKNNLMEEIFRLHGLPFGPPPGVEDAYDILVRTGRTPCFPKFFDASWEWKGTVEDALQEMVGFIAMHGGRPRHREIEKILSHCQQDGRVRHTTEVEEGLIVWPVQ